MPGNVMNTTRPDPKYLYMFLVFRQSESFLRTGRTSDSKIRWFESALSSELDGQESLKGENMFFCS